MQPYIAGVIFARGGSKGVPRKNIRLLAGKPLIAHAIEAAKAVPVLKHVFVSTDDPEIAEVARRYGAEVPFLRPTELAQDHSPEWLAWQHAIRALQHLNGGRGLDIMVSVPATSPLRLPKDIEACLGALQNSDADVSIMITETQRNPYYNMVAMEGKYARVAVAPPKPIVRRQDAPVVFDMTTVAYAARAEFILKSKSLFEGKATAALVPPERSLDIDTEFDFKLAEFMLEQSKLEPCKV